VFQTICSENPSVGGQRLYRNKGDGTFTAITNSSLVTITTGSPEGIAWGDYNNDGRMDVFIAGGWMNKNLLFRNDGGGQFTRITDVAPIKAGAGYWDSATWADYDNDGFLDLFVANYGGGNNFLYRNNGNSNHWLKIKLVGK